MRWSMDEVVITLNRLGFSYCTCMYLPKPYYYNILNCWKRVTVE